MDFLCGIVVKDSFELQKPLLNLKCLAVAFAVFLICTNTFAHFNLDMNIRTIHVVHTQSGLDVYLRIPTPYFLAGLVGKQNDDGTVDSAPFTYNRTEQSALFHYLDTKELEGNPFEFAKIAAEGLEIETNNTYLSPQIIAVRVHPALYQPPFTTLSEVESAMVGDVFPYPIDEIYVGETVTDLHLRYSYDGSVNTYKLASKFNPGLPGQEKTANLLLDHFPGETRVFRLTGLLNDPVEITNSTFAAVTTFVLQGIVHIIEGLDHLLFVICLTIGAVGLGGLLWRVTGFTIGHTITLIAGFWGFVPSGAWFIPTVELGIAVSIIWVAINAIRTWGRQYGQHESFIITFLIGLLHGLGFSFILHEFLLPNGAHLWKSLLSFNIGVEIGQIIIVAAVWAILFLITRIKQSLLIPTRWVVALPCAAIAALWIVERGRILYDSLPIG